MSTDVQRGLSESRRGLAIEHLGRAVRLVALVAGSVVVAGGCGGGEPGAAPSTSASSSKAGAPSATSVGSGPPATSQSVAAGAGSGAPGGGSSAPAGASPFAGTWKGSYRAEKVNPTLDPTVKDEVWKDDDGKRHTGSGRIELTIVADGTATGTIEGPLGAGDVRGVADETMVRAMIAPTGEEGPSGTLIGKPAEKGLAVEVRASDGAGKAPRIARGTLEKVP